MAEVTGRAVRPVGYTAGWLLATTQGVPPLPGGVTRNPDGTVTLTFPSDVTPECLALVKRRMETWDDAEADLLTTLAADYDANAAAMPFANDQIQALTEQMQRVIRLVTGRTEPEEP